MWLADRFAIHPGLFAEWHPAPDSPLRQVEAVEVHHLVPCRHEVVHELFLRVAGGVHLGQCAQLRVRAEHQIDHGGSPFALAAVAVAASSEEHTSELQSLMRISYAVFCLTKKK